MSRVSKNNEFDVRTDREKSAEKSAFVERLHTILSHWPSADRLARAIGVSPSAFRKWLKGEAEPSRERLVALARAAGVGIGWLADGEGQIPNFEPAQRSGRRSDPAVQPGEIDWRQFELLPKQRIKGAAAGNSAPAQQDSAPWIALHHDWIRLVCGVEPCDLLLEIAIGESMLPTIRDGHTLLIDTTDRLFHYSGIYVLEVNGQRLVKRVQRKHNDTLVLISDNVAYQADIVDKGSATEIVVVGRVVWAGGGL